MGFDPGAVGLLQASPRVTPAQVPICSWDMEFYSQKAFLVAWTRGKDSYPFVLSVSPSV